MIRLFIVDDHYMVIEGVHSMMKMEKNIEWMGHATNAESCLYFLQNHRPDVILMDISMPGKSGIELCREVNAQYPGIAIIALSTFNQGSYINKMIEHGALGYVLKNASRQELMEAIETVAKGKQFLSFDVAAMMRQQEQQEIVLTRREKEVLELISSGMTNAEIAEKLFISITTVISHRKNILEKFGVNNTAGLVKRAVEGGWV